jgi:hypothetical protein
MGVMWPTGGAVMCNSGAAGRACALTPPDRHHPRKHDPEDARPEPARTAWRGPHRGRQHDPGIAYRRLPHRLRYPCEGYAGLLVGHYIHRPVDMLGDKPVDATGKSACKAVFARSKTWRIGPAIPPASCGYSRRRRGAGVVLLANVADACGPGRHVACPQAVDLFGLEWPR